MKEIPGLDQLKLETSNLIQAQVPNRAVRHLLTQSLRAICSKYEEAIDHLEADLYLAQMGHKAPTTIQPPVLPLFRIGQRVWQAPDAHWTEADFHRLIHSTLPADTLSLIEQRGFILVEDGGPTKPHAAVVTPKLKVKSQMQPHQEHRMTSRAADIQHSQSQARRLK